MAGGRSRGVGKPGGGIVRMHCRGNNSVHTKALTMTVKDPREYDSDILRLKRFSLFKIQMFGIIGLKGFNIKRYNFINFLISLFFSFYQ